MCSVPSRCMRISPSNTIIVSSESAWMCSGVTLPKSIRSSKRMNAPLVSSAVAFQMCSPPPYDHRRSPSSFAFITYLGAVLVLIVVSLRRISSWYTSTMKRLTYHKRYVNLLRDRWALGSERTHPGGVGCRSARSCCRRDDANGGGRRRGRIGLSDDCVSLLPDQACLAARSPS